MQVPREYAISAFAFSIVRAVFVGYLYRDFSLRFHNAAVFGGGWFFWTFFFGILFLAVSFAPKPHWASCLNPFTVTLVIWLIYYLGMSHSEFIRMHVREMVTFSIGSMGGPIWIMVATWIWHFIVCFRMFTGETETA